jgi:DnaD/phage-associated family protein
MDYAQDGDLSRYDTHDVADACYWDGEPEILLNSLIDSGFIDRSDDGLKIHDWYEYAGRLIEKKEQNRERKRKSRARHADVTWTSQEEKREVTEMSASVTGLPNLTIPNLTINTPTTTNTRDEEQDGKVFRTFEQEGFGTLSSVLVDDLRDMIDTYSAEWVIRAMHEAVRSGKRNLRYVLAILKRWKAEGIDEPWEVRGNAEHGRSNQRGMGEFDFLSL